MNFGIIVDIALLVIAIFIIIKFTIKGFFSSILDVCKLGLSAIIAYIVRMPLAKLFSSLFMKNAMKSVVKTSCEAYLNTDLAKISIDHISSCQLSKRERRKALTTVSLSASRTLRRRT